MMHQYYPAALTHGYAYELHKDMTFSAAHLIPHESAGKCRNVHGHTYVVNITIVGDNLDAAGFLVDFRELKRLIHDRYDHTLLNDFPEFSLPSTEVVAKCIADRIQSYIETLPNEPKCPQIIVRETPESYVIYRPRPEVPDVTGA